MLARDRKIPLGVHLNTVASHGTTMLLHRRVDRWLRDKVRINLVPMCSINDLRVNLTVMRQRALRSLRRLLMVRLSGVIGRMESSGPLVMFLCRVSSGVI